MHELIAELALGFIWWVVFFPIVWLVSTPVILVVAAFRRKPYRAAVSEMYGAVRHFWKEWGVLLVP
jgi:heme/copper-type cytochrome/quinol oxidase subunit 2